MSIHVHLTDDDYIRFNQFYATRTKRGKRFLLPLRLMPPMVFTPLLLLDVLKGENGWTFYVIFAILALPGCIAWFFLAPAYLRWSIRRRIPRLKKTGKLPYTPDADFTWDEESFTETTENSTHRVPFGEIEHFYVMPDYAFIFVDAMRGYLIPRFASHPEIEEFIDFLKSHVPCEELN